MKRRVGFTAAGLLVLARVVRLTFLSVLHGLGLNPTWEGETYQLPGKRALILTTSHGVLNAPGETDGPATGVAYDLGTSDALAEKIRPAYYAGSPILGGVCHGPLGFIQARDREGGLLIEGRRMTGVTDKQVRESGIEITPLHPETELRRAGVPFESEPAFRDLFATHVVVDDEKRFVTGQNQNLGHETAHTMMAILAGQL